MALVPLVGGCFEQPQMVADTGGSTTEAADTTDDDERTTGPAPTSGITDGSDGATTTGDRPATGSASDGEQNLPDGEGCCEAHRGAGCNEPEVAACVCRVDVSCCGFDWTSECVQIAMARCDASCQASETGATSGAEETTGPEETTGSQATTTDGSTTTDGAPGDCCDVQSTPGCADEAIQACACELDGYCCSTAWDQLCVDQATESCALVCP